MKLNLENCFFHSITTILLNSREKGVTKFNSIKKGRLLSKNIEFKSELKFRNLGTLHIRDEVYKPQFVLS
jgi:hypothetical protein